MKSHLPHLFKCVLLRCIVLSSFVGLMSGCSSLLYYPVKEPFTDPAQFRHKPVDVDFVTSDGIHLHGWYFKSRVRPAKATVLLFHGNAQNITTHFFSLYWALEEGLDYFIFDYRGYGQSEGKPSPEGTVIDGHAAVNWIKAHKDPATKLVIFGQSLGGAIAMRVACELPAADYDKLVVDSTFLSYRKVAQKVLAKSWITWPFQWIGWLVMNDSYSAKDCIQNVAPHPLLVIHGVDDQVVPFALGEKIYEVANPPKEFWQIEGGRHTDFLFRENFRFQKMFLDWITKGPSAPERVQRFAPLAVQEDEKSP